MTSTQTLLPVSSFLSFGYYIFNLQCRFFLCFVPWEKFIYEIKLYFVL